MESAQATVYLSAGMQFELKQNKSKCEQRLSEYKAVFSEQINKYFTFIFKETPRARCWMSIRPATTFTTCLSSTTFLMLRLPITWGSDTNVTQQAMEIHSDAALTLLV